LVGEPFKFDLGKHDKAKIRLTFYKWMGEPDYQVELTEPKNSILKICFDPKTSKW